MRTLAPTITKLQFERMVMFEPTSGCWIFIHGSLTTDGYTRYNAIFAHRISYFLYVGKIPAKHDIHHTCKLPCCVNPAHLKIIPHADHTSLHSQTKIKSHCKRGHLFTQRSTYVYPNGKRQCRYCLNINQRIRRHKYR